MEFMWNEVERFLFFLLVRRERKRDEKNTIMCKLSQVVIKIEVGFTISHSFCLVFVQTHAADGR